MKFKIKAKKGYLKGIRLVNFEQITQLMHDTLQQRLESERSARLGAESINDRIGSLTRAARSRTIDLRVDERRAQPAQNLEVQIAIGRVHLLENNKRILGRRALEAPIDRLELIGAAPRRGAQLSQQHRLLPQLLRQTPINLERGADALMLLHELAHNRVAAPRHKLHQIAAIVIQLEVVRQHDLLQLIDHTLVPLARQIRRGATPRRLSTHWYQTIAFDCSLFSAFSISICCSDFSNRNALTSFSKTVAKLAKSLFNSSLSSPNSQ